MDGRILVAILLLSGGTMLVQVYRRARREIDATNARITKNLSQEVVGASGSARVITSKRRWSLMPRLSIDIPGLGTFGADKSEAYEARDVMQSLNETIRLKFNPADPQSARQAIRQVELDIDAKIAPYRHNKMVVELATKLKNDYRRVLQEQIEKLARSSSQPK